MSDYIQQLQTPQSYYDSNGWIILSNIENNIKRKIEKNGTQLKDWNIKINYGIKTGYNDAFIIDKVTKDMLIQSDPKSADVIRPILRGRDIKKFHYESSNLYLLFIPWHFPLQNSELKGASLVAEQAFKKDYNAIYNYLLSFKVKLSNRNKSETGIRYEWYSLQRWASNYSDDFFKQKIIFQEMVQGSSFYLDKEGKYFCLDTGRIIVGDKLPYLTGLLNSNLFFFAIKHFYGGGKLGETGVRMKHTFFSQFSAYIPNEKEEKYISELVSQISNLEIAASLRLNLERKINDFFYSTYGISDIEKAFIMNEMK